MIFTLDELSILTGVPVGVLKIYIGRGQIFSCGETGFGKDEMPLKEIKETKDPALWPASRTADAPVSQPPNSPQWNVWSPVEVVLVAVQAAWLRKLGSAGTVAPNTARHLAWMAKQTVLNLSAGYAGADLWVGCVGYPRSVGSLLHGGFGVSGTLSEIAFNVEAEAAEVACAAARPEECGEFGLPSGTPRAAPQKLYLVNVSGVFRDVQRRAYERGITFSLDAGDRK